ncbi:MAG: hypothetical protein ACYCPT_06235 [Acidimicrobiales bacterium]
MQPHACGADFLRQETDQGSHRLSAMDPQCYEIATEGVEQGLLRAWNLASP